MAEVQKLLLALLRAVVIRLAEGTPVKLSGAVLGADRGVERSTSRRAVFALGDPRPRAVLVDKIVGGGVFGVAE